MSNPKSILAASAGLVILSGTAQAQDATQGIPARLRHCILSHAAEVESATPNLTDATSFIVEDLCAVEVRAFGQYRMSEEILASARKQTAQDSSTGLPPKARAKYDAALVQYRVALDHTVVDPETGQVKMPIAPIRPDSDTDIEVNGTVSGIYTTDAFAFAPPEIRAEAARALLDARRARLTSQHSQ